MKTKTEVEINHVDILGQKIVIGVHVAMPYRNSMVVGKVIRLTNKMVRVAPIKHIDSNYLVYPHEVIILTGEDAMVYILKNS